jgi:N-acetylglucosaminyldiphosphoundecaprenol N-acetyl-beta-D-mannosaminyltransferase
MRPSILGVGLDPIGSRDELIGRFRSLLEAPATHAVYTPNPEILLYARDHPGFAALLDSADLLLPDGVGVVLVQSLRRGPPLRRWVGVDAAELLVDLAADLSLPITLVGGTGGAAGAAADHLRRARPGLRVEVAGDGVRVGDDGVEASTEEATRIEEAILGSGSGVVLVAFGAPKQERWIARRRSDFPDVRVMMGVGGAFDMWAGRFPRAPGSVRALGLEWLWRLAHQPSRLPRTLRATVVFPWHALRNGGRVRTRPDA